MIAAKNLARSESGRNLPRLAYPMDGVRTRKQRIHGNLGDIVRRCDPTSVSPAMGSISEYKWPTTRSDASKLARYGCDECRRWPWGPTDADGLQADVVRDLGIRQAREFHI
jgi:hypothetical protein